VDMVYDFDVDVDMDFDVAGRGVGSIGGPLRFNDGVDGPGRG
jgi:hypothetical protein